MTKYEETRSKQVATIRNDKVRDILKVMQSTRKYPIDAITEGAFDILVQYLIDLEHLADKSKIQNLDAFDEVVYRRLGWS